jgi:hypothetical protein
MPRPIIFPLRAKVNRPFFAQQRPKVTGGRRVVLLPVLPWVDSDRPPNIQYGRVQGVPTLNMTAWIGYGLCAVDDARSIRLRDVKQPVLRPSLGPKRVPDVVHGLKPLPAVFFTLTGTTRDSGGAALGACMVELFRAVDDVKIGNTVSNADDGKFEFRGLVRGALHYVRAYRAGSPDVAGTTVETLVSDQG